MLKSCPTEPVAGRPRDKEKQRERGVRDWERWRWEEERDHREVTEKEKLMKRCLRRCGDWERSVGGDLLTRKMRNKKGLFFYCSRPSFSSTS